MRLCTSDWEGETFPLAPCQGPPRTCLCHCHPHLPVAESQGNALIFSLPAGSAQFGRIDETLFLSAPREFMQGGLGFPLVTVPPPPLLTGYFPLLPP